MIAQSRVALLEPRSAADPPTSRYAAHVVGLSVLLVPVAVSPSLADAFALPKQAVLIGLGVAAVIGLGRTSGKRLSMTGANGLVVGLIVAMLALDVAATAFSGNPELALLGVAGFGNGLAAHLSIAALLTLAMCSDTEDANLVLCYGAWGAALVAAYASTQALDLDPIEWSLKGRVFSSLGNPNDLAGYAVGTIAFAGAFRWDQRTRLLLWGYLALVVWIVLLTGSRSGMVGLVAAFTVLPVLEAVGGANLNNVVRLSAVLGAAIAAGMLLTLLVHPADQGQVYDQKASQVADDLALRAEIWSRSIEAIWKHPLLGIGPSGVFETTLSRAPTAPVVTSPHSALLEVALGAGLPSAVVMCSLAAIAVRRLLVTLHSTADHAALPWLGAGLLGYGAFASFNPITLSEITVSGVLLGTLFRLTFRPRAVSQRPSLMEERW